MQKDIMIKLQGSQNVSSQTTDSIELTTTGIIEYLEMVAKLFTKNLS